MPNSSGNIPPEAAKELRALAHELSNALETIVQASYLLTQANPPENMKRWVDMIDKASQDAVDINRNLRHILRSRS
jgi:nitrogen-specific signal transduction histidine kinase